MWWWVELVCAAVLTAAVVSVWILCSRWTRSRHYSRRSGDDIETGGKQIGENKSISSQDSS